MRNRFGNTLRTLAAVGLLSAVTAGPAWARVKLITLPVRERVEVQLDHESATLVEEERIVPLVKGVNQVDFSWDNTAIDPGTIVFRVIGPAGGQNLAVNVLSVSYPPGENALVWQVASSDSGSARVRISYLLGNLQDSFNYRAIASHDETTLTLSQYLRVRNLAGEAYDDTTLHVGFGDTFSRPIGLNETKEILVQRYQQVPIRKTYTCDPAQFGYIDQPQNKLRVPMHYVLTNNQGHKLGSAPLPAGKARIYQQDGRGSTAFLGEDWGQFTPIDDEMKLALGIAQDISIKRTIQLRKRDRIAGDLSNYHIVIRYEIENFKDQPVTLDIAETIPQVRQEAHLPGHRLSQWTLGDKTTLPAGPDMDKTTIDRVLHHVDLPARTGDKAEILTYDLHLIFHNEWD